MNDSHWRRERLIVDAVDHRLRRVTVWDRFASIVTDAELLGLVVFCMIGLLLSLIVTLAVPGFSEVAETLQQML